MQRWGQYLAEVPQTLLRLIASHQRVSMPRQCPPAERLSRLRAAICRSAAAREAFFGLHAEERAAVQALLVAPPGAARAQLIADLGPIRPLAALRADRAPQSLAERLLLMGWLLPRPAGPRHPATYLLAPELRDWLPRPLDLPASPPPPTAPELPLALRAATAIILAAARAPLPLRANGRPSAVALRRLRPLLAPAAPDEADSLVSWLLPLLADRDLLAAHGAAAAPGPAAGRFLAQGHAARRELLRAAWV
ncbi:WYL domain-containing protein, partial [Oscillochloris sp. ZM17-4]|nr:WYL domain-containing protein [Oscillochloris sp. ZM17-4]